MKIKLITMALLVATVGWMADTNVIFETYSKGDFTIKMPTNPPALIEIYTTNMTEILRIRNIVASKNKNGYLDLFDYTATNMEIICTQEPVIVGKTNGQWIIRFKP